MKKAGVFLILVLILAPKTLAETHTGNVSSQTTTTNVINNGSITSHTETTVNGQTTTVDTDQPGSVDIENHNGKVTVKTSADVSVTITQHKDSESATPSATPTPPHKNFVFKVFDGIRNFLLRIFHNL